MSSIPKAPPSTGPLRMVRSRESHPRLRCSGGLRQWIHAALMHSRVDSPTERAVAACWRSLSERSSPCLPHPATDQPPPANAPLAMRLVAIAPKRAKPDQERVADDAIAGVGTIKVLRDKRPRSAASPLAKRGVAPKTAASNLARKTQVVAAPAGKRAQPAGMATQPAPSHASKEPARLSSNSAAKGWHSTLKHASVPAVPLRVQQGAAPSSMAHTCATTSGRVTQPSVVPAEISASRAPRRSNVLQASASTQNASRPRTAVRPLLASPSAATSSSVSPRLRVPGCPVGGHSPVTVRAPASVSSRAIPDSR